MNLEAPRSPGSDPLSAPPSLGTHLFPFTPKIFISIIKYFCRLRVLNIYSYSWGDHCRLVLDGSVENQRNDIPSLPSLLVIYKTNYGFSSLIICGDQTCRQRKWNKFVWNYLKWSRTGHILLLPPDCPPSLSPETPRSLLLSSFFRWIWRLWTFKLPPPVRGRWRQVWSVAEVVVVEGSGLSWPYNVDCSNIEWWPELSQQTTD